MTPSPTSSAERERGDLSCSLSSAEREQGDFRGLIGHWSLVLGHSRPRALPLGHWSLLLGHFRLALLLLLVPALPTQASEITRVWAGWKTASAFDRLGEYFPGLDRSKESPVLVTQAKARDGYYFSVRLENDAPSPGATIELSVITPISPKPQTHTFKVDLTPGTRTYNIGVTGSDWPAASATPVAWSITINSADGKLLASKKSFLWE